MYDKVTEELKEPEYQALAGPLGNQNCSGTPQNKRFYEQNNSCACAL